MIVRIFKKKKNGGNSLVEPDEIFLDSKNLENFDSQQFEGRIEKPISRRTITALLVLFLFFTNIFAVRLSYLQIKEGDWYKKRSEANTLKELIIFSDRGIIYDRNRIELAWNKQKNDIDGVVDVKNTSKQDRAKGDLLYTRSYIAPGFSHLLGYVSYPAKDNTGAYWQKEFVGKDGLEKQYDARLKGENGAKIAELNALREIQSENITNSPKRGADLVTTIDSKVQKALFSLLEDFSNRHSFKGGGGIILDARNGEVLASSSFPEYDSEILSFGSDAAKIKTYIQDRRKFFLDRVISGLYTPGSIIKPFLALGALNEDIIDERKKILSTGSISIPNPYFPEQKSIFKDWKAHGWTDMRAALAVSSDVYFYSIGGGYGDQKGLGIANIEKYTRLFGIGQTTGVDLPDEKAGAIPSPEWKLKNFKGDPWRIGDTYHTAIGQYGFQVTPLEITRATATIANYGKLITPHLILGDSEKEKDFTALDLKKEHLDIVREGMRQAVSYGTALALNVPYVKVAAKTGTAELGINKKKINSWVTGFFPYENPRYAFTMMLESGPETSSGSATGLMRALLDWMYVNTPEHLE